MNTQNTTTSPTPEERHVAYQAKLAQPFLGHGGPRPEVDMNAVWAKIIGLSARNSVETLHSEGAFSDQQAPALNRRLRGRAYELMIAVVRHEPDDALDPFTLYLRQLAGTRRGILAFAALRGGIALAVDEFAAAEGISPPVAHELAREAGRGAVSGFKRVIGLHHGDARAERRLTYLLNMIPDCWEMPAVSPEFQKRLDEPAAG